MREGEEREAACRTVTRKVGSGPDGPSGSTMMSIPAITPSGTVTITEPPGWAALTGATLVYLAASAPRNESMYRRLASGSSARLVRHPELRVSTQAHTLYKTCTQVGTLIWAFGGYPGSAIFLASSAEIRPTCPWFSKALFITPIWSLDVTKPRPRDGIICAPAISLTDTQQVSSVCMRARINTDATG